VKQAIVVRSAPESSVTAYRRTEEVPIGSFALEEFTEAEKKRRARQGSS
jgi:hypothetical protein